VRHCNGDFCGAEIMTKGKPWPIEDEKKLREWVTSDISVEAIIFSFDGKYTKDAIVQKMFDLKLKTSKEEKIDISRKKPIFFSSKLELPNNLPTVEEALQILASALRKGAEAGLNKDEIQRLQVVATLAKTYKEIFADYLDYRGLEEELLESRRNYAELKEKYEELTKKSQDNASK
jgi:hypothetical protein